LRHLQYLIHRERWLGSHFVAYPRQKAHSVIHRVERKNNEHTGNASRNAAFFKCRENA
jgi:hypothetical protein